MRTIPPTTTATRPPPSKPASPDALPALGDGIVDAIVEEIHRVVGSLRCAGTGRMVKAGISMTHLHILWFLDHHGELPLSRLAALLDVSVSNATGPIDRMEHGDLVERVRVADDRRGVIV